jgi:Zn-dependent M28 family amino/carboxypeptidase
MDGKGWVEAANDDTSGMALGMEIAQILSAPEVITEWIRTGSGSPL